MVSKEEVDIFDAFQATLPNFAGREVKCERGADPPDFVGTDSKGLRVGIELGEWLDQRQMAVAIARERQKDSFLEALKSEEQEPPKNIGRIWIGKPERVALSDDNKERFREEAYRCIADADSIWEANPDWEGPQGFQLRDFANYPTLKQYLVALDFMPRTRYPAAKGIAWVTFPNEGGAYTPKSAVDALLAMIRKKASMYDGLHKKENLQELYLLAYYDRGLIHNTPYFAPNFGWDEVAAIAADEVKKNPGPFQKVFLFNSLPVDRTVTLLYP